MKLKYRCGRRKFGSLELTLAWAKHIHEKTGVIAGIEEIKPKEKPCTNSPVT